MTTEEKQREVFERDGFICQVCGKHISTGRGQMAHLIGNTELNRKLYGSELIDSLENVVTVCSLDCNKKVDLGRIPSRHREFIRRVKGE